MKRLVRFIFGRPSLSWKKRLALEWLLLIVGALTGIGLGIIANAQEHEDGLVVWSLPYVLLQFVRSVSWAALSLFARAPSKGDLDGDSGRSTPPQRLVHGGILVCRKCGSKNRVGSYSPKLRPVCGNCGGRLSGPLAATLKRVVSRFRPVWIGACVVIILAGLAILLFHTRQPEEASRERISSATPSGNTGEPKEDSRPQLNRRLPHGTVIRSVKLDGSGKLEISNGLAYDAAAKLVDPQTGQCAAYFHISSGTVFTLPDIPDGNYRLLFGVGEDWDDAKGFFSRSKGVSEFSRTLLFETRQRKEADGSYQEYTEHKMTLHPVPSGNARTHSVSLVEFEKY